jgi:hypothetical protein
VEVARAVAVRGERSASPRPGSLARWELGFGSADGALDAVAVRSGLRGFPAGLVGTRIRHRGSSVVWLQPCRIVAIGPHCCDWYMCDVSN